jgi:hypothetical protein
MSIAKISDQDLLTTEEVLDQMEQALMTKSPFSLVRIGDGDNIVLGQYTHLPEEEFLNSYWVRESRGEQSKGVRLPDLKLRDDMLTAIDKANVVGICKNKDEIRVPERYKRELTNEIFDYYGLRPSQVCHNFVNRRMVSLRAFWKLLHTYPTLLISRWARRFAHEIRDKYQTLPPQIIGCISFTDYRQVEKTIKKVGNYRFDLALISAGCSACVLAQRIAEQYGKVAVDFGKSMMFMVKQSERITPWTPEVKNEIR